MGTLILPDWNYPRTRRAMTDAERWTRDPGFVSGTDFMNQRGEKLAQLLDAEPTATASGVVNLRWTFPDGSAVVLGQATWKTIQGEGEASFTLPLIYASPLSRPAIPSSLRAISAERGRIPAVQIRTNLHRAAQGEQESQRLSNRSGVR